MKLARLEHHRIAVVGGLDEATNSVRLQSVGIHPGAAIEILSATSSRGLLVKVDDTRLVLSLELASKIECYYR